MKKKIALLVSLLFAISIITGCSQADIGYLQLNKNINSANTGTFTGTIKAIYDEKAIIDSFDRIFDPSSLDSAGHDTSLPITAGKKDHFTLNYYAQIITEDGLRFHYSFNGDIAGQKINLGDIYFDEQKGFCLSKQTVLGLFDLAKYLDTDHKDTYYYSTEFRNSLDKALGDSDYIILNDPEDLTAFSDSFTEYTTSTQNTNQAILEATITFLTTAFRDFSPNCIARITNGYELNLTLHDTFHIIINSIDYIMDHNDEFYPALEMYINTLADHPYYQSLFLGNEETTPFAFSIQDKKDFNMGLNEIRSYLKTSLVNGSLDNIKDSRYNVKLTKDKNTFQSYWEFSFLYDGLSLLDIQSTSTIIPNKTKIDFPNDAIAGDVVRQQLDQLMTNLQPATDVILYYPILVEGEDYDLQEANTWITRTTENVPFWVTSDQYSASIPCYIEEEQVYLPLRNLCDSLNEEYGWNSETKQAYVLRNGKQIVVSGTIHDATFFVKLSDFEKLGYTITDGIDKWERSLITITSNTQS